MADELYNLLQATITEMRAQTKAAEESAARAEELFRQIREERKGPNDRAT